MPDTQPTTPGWLGAIPAIGSVAGSLIDAISGNATNKANARMAREQMQFQREQRDTQYQSKVADLKAAGLNPALAYEGSGNTAQTGTTGAPQQPVTHNSAQAITNAIAAYTQLSQATAQNQLTRAQTGLVEEQERNAAMTRLLQTPDAQLAQSGDYLSEYMKNKIAALRSGRFTSERTEEQFRANIRNLNQTTDTARAAQDEARSRITLNEQEFMNKWFREKVAPYVNSTAKTVGAIRGVKF